MDCGRLQRCSLVPTVRCFASEEVSEELQEVAHSTPYTPLFNETLIPFWGAL